MIHRVSGLATMPDAITLALCGVQRLSNLLKNIKDAPAAITRLENDTNALSGSLTLLQKINESTWRPLGNTVYALVKVTIRNAETACCDMHRVVCWSNWTKGGRGSRTWRDPLNVGVFQQKNLETWSRLLRMYILTFNCAVGMATLYKSIIQRKKVEGLQAEISTQRSDLEAAISSMDIDIVVVEHGLAEIQLTPQQDLTEDDEQDRHGAEMAFEEFEKALRLGQALLAKLVEKSQDEELAQATLFDPGPGITVSRTSTFGPDVTYSMTNIGGDNQGVQFVHNTGTIIYNGRVL